jgi:hypothetical protein
VALCLGRRPVDAVVLDHLGGLVIPAQIRPGQRQAGREHVVARVDDSGRIDDRAGLARIAPVAQQCHEEGQGTGRGRVEEERPFHGQEDVLTLVQLGGHDGGADEGPRRRAVGRREAEPCLEGFLRLPEQSFARFRILRGDRRAQRLPVEPVVDGDVRVESTGQVVQPGGSRGLGQAVPVRGQPEEVRRLLPPAQSLQKLGLLHKHFAVGMVTGSHDADVQGPRVEREGCLLVGEADSAGGSPQQISGDLAQQVRLHRCRTEALSRHVEEVVRPAVLPAQGRQAADGEDQVHGPHFGLQGPVQELLRLRATAGGEMRLRQRRQGEGVEDVGRLGAQLQGADGELRRLVQPTPESPCGPRGQDQQGDRRARRQVAARKKLPQYGEGGPWHTVPEALRHPGEVRCEVGVMARVRHPDDLRAGIPCRGGEGFGPAVEPPRPPFLPS